MHNPYQPPTAVVSDPHPLPKRAHPVLIWLAAGYWLVNGAAHLLQLIPAIPVLTDLPGVMLIAAAAATLIGALSIGGGIMLLRHKKKAIPLLASVFAIVAIWFLIRLFWVPATGLSLDTMIEGLIACASMGYSLFLAKRGVLK